MTRTRSTRRSFSRVALVSTSIAAAGLLAPAASWAGGADAPVAATNPSVDTSGLYAFSSPDQPDTVTIIATSWPMQEAGGGPIFYPFATARPYEINIDSDGDGVANLIYRYAFKTTQTPDSGILYADGSVTSLDDSNLLFRQTYTLTRIQKTPGARNVITRLATDVPVAPSVVGSGAMPDYGRLVDQAVTGITGGGSTFAGQADDPSFADQRVWDLLYGGNLSEVGQDTYAGRNTNAIALQVPKAQLALNGDAVRNPVIGVWATAGSRLRGTRIGQPLVNDLLVPFKDKDRFNTSTPATDDALLTATLQDPQFPKLIQSIYGIPAPRAPRNDLTEIYLRGICKDCGGPLQADLNAQSLNDDVPAGTAKPAEELRLNTAVPVSAFPNRLGVLGGDLAGYPNGRRLADDVTDVTVQALEGSFSRGLPPVIVAPLAAGDAVNENDRAFRTTFPYLALPASGNSPLTASLRTSAAPTPAPDDSGTTLLVLVLGGALLVQPTIG